MLPSFKIVVIDNRVRKRRDVSERLPASLAAATISAMKGASIIRVHDVRETVDAVKVVTAMEEAGR